MRMINNLLAASVEQFAARLAGTPDARLDETWVWNSYDSDGVRFAFFRTYEDLRELAARLLQQRSANGSPRSEAQHLLAQYHGAYRDMLGALLGLTPAQMLQSPGENDWSLRKVLAHILQADIGFFVVVAYALESIRARSPQTNTASDGYTPNKISDAAWERIAGLNDAAEKALIDGPLEPILSHLSAVHSRVLGNFALISAAELDAPSLYWEDEPYSLRFRLHRFDSHMRQHTIHIDKTRVSLGLPPTESQHLLRLIYAALAEVEGALIGFAQPLPPAVTETARAIDARLAEIAP